jgi:hypothetical protein
MKLSLNFLQDFDDSYEEYKKIGIELNHIPHVGECLHVNGFYHRVIDVAYYDDGRICLHLGQSAQSPEEARSKGYGIWNS